MLTNGAVFEKLDNLRSKIIDILEVVQDEMLKEDLDILLEDVEEEIKHFDKEDYYGELKKVENLIGDWNELEVEERTKERYYDFGYFFNRKDSGSFYVTLRTKLDTEDILECVNIAMQYNMIDEEYADNIIYVEELTKEDAISFGMKVTEK